MSLSDSHAEDRIDVSVIIPVYNAAKYLSETISYMTQQSFDKYEVILVDDGSTDSSGVIAKKAAESDSRIIYAWQENSGAGAARNHGISLARGRWLLFLDADDVFERDLLSKLYQAATKDGSEVVVCESDAFSMDPMRPTIENTGHRGLDAGVYTHEDVRKCLFQVFKGCPWNKLFSREFIEGHSLRFQTLHHSNDAYFTFTALSIARQLTLIDDVLVHYRQVAGSSLRGGKIVQPLCDCISLDSVRSSLKSLGLLDHELRMSLDNYFITLIVNMILLYASQAPEAGEELHAAFYSGYVQKWDIQDAKYPYITSRARAWLFRSLQIVPYEKIAKVCGRSRFDRSKGRTGSTEKVKIMAGLAFYRALYGNRQSKA